VKKLKLNELKVSSFVILKDDDEQLTIRAGVPNFSDGPPTTSHADPSGTSQCNSQHCASQYCSSQYCARQQSAYCPIRFARHKLFDKQLEERYHNIIIR